MSKKEFEEHFEWIITLVRNNLDQNCAQKCKDLHYIFKFDLNCIRAKCTDLDLKQYSDTSYLVLAIIIAEDLQDSILPYYIHDKGCQVPG